MTEKQTVVEDGFVVEFSLKITDSEDGELLMDSTDEEDEPHLAMVYGMPGIVPPPLWEAMGGKSVGETVRVNLESDDAYGPEYDDAYFHVPLEYLKDIPDLEIGEYYSLADDNDDVLAGCLVEINKDENYAVINANHPLAGRDVSLEAEIIGVRKATTEEIAEMMEILAELAEMGEEDDEG